VNEQPKIRILFDEDSQRKTTVSELAASGCDVATVYSLGLTDADDDVVLAAAIESERILVTRNADDFLALHRTGIQHPGILAFYPPFPAYWKQARTILNAIKVYEGNCSNEFIGLSPFVDYPPNSDDVL